MNELIMQMGKKFAALTRYTVGRSRRESYQAESVWLKGGYHFLCEGDTPEEAVRELMKQVKDYDPL